MDQSIQQTSPVNLYNTILGATLTTAQVQQAQDEKRAQEEQIKVLEKQQREQWLLQANTAGLIKELQRVSSMYISQAKNTVANTEMDRHRSMLLLCSNIIDKVEVLIRTGAYNV